MSLRLRLTLWYGLLLFLTLLAFATLLDWRMSRALHRQLDATLREEASEVAGGLAPPPDFVLVRDGQAGPFTLTSEGYSTQVIDRAEWRLYRPPGGHFVLGHSEESLEQTLHELAMMLLLAVPLTVLAAGAGGMFLAERALRPIDRITRAAAAIGAGDLSRRLERPPADDELGRLTSTFNAMLARLEASFRKQRQFASDAAHELRTPLSLVLARAEVTLDSPRTVEEYQAALREVQQEAHNLDRLTSKLLALARSESEVPDPFERLNLRELAGDVVESLQDRAGKVRLTCRGEDTWLDGDQTRLTQLLLNLVENALQHTPPDGSVEVLTTGRGFQVIDTGCGIAAEHLPRIFERFYRVDWERRESSGLGLAICQAIVAQHGGKLTCHSELGKGSTFNVDFM